ncbi:unnamed protein product [Prorocentrum cordatum]|uniref:DNA-(apurinic or apyrimidinic site) lyase n=1 Tax=Prorocentrum cordatum TaxID=2364126 RepID=A0ABN9UJ88_9DINO|nr:unnamed protein product [Polarella glacialis]
MATSPARAAPPRAGGAAGGRVALVLGLPPGFDLAAAACSYGFRAVWAALRQRACPRALEVRVPRGCPRLRTADVRGLEAQVRRMLRLRAGDAAVARRFGALCPDLAAGGPVGRLFRSPTLFEDLVKTVTLCNCGWGRTISMNEALCGLPSAAAGAAGAFPTPAELSRTTPARLRRSCGVGYRAERLVRLARACVRGEVPLASLDAAGPTAETAQSIAAIHGFGPFAAANVLQLLGGYERMPPGSAPPRPSGRGARLPRRDAGQRGRAGGEGLCPVRSVPVPAVLDRAVANLRAADGRPGQPGGPQPLLAPHRRAHGRGAAAARRPAAGDRRAGRARQEPCFPAPPPAPASKAARRG